MAFPESVAQLPPEGTSGQAIPHRFGLYSLISGCFCWAILLLFNCLFFSLFAGNGVSGGTFLRALSTGDLLTLLVAVGAIVFGHLGLLKGPSQRRAAITGLVLGYLSFLPLLVVGLLCLGLIFFPLHLQLEHVVL
ncbi:MAG TPA: hypothetical protein VN729_04605 [Ktedonobacteraceae bacterium]|nr:hypothetical protein [Ktedonobacteraceae bacterium]